MFTRSLLRCRYQAIALFPPHPERLRFAVNQQLLKGARGLQLIGPALQLH
jgi:hypothetical protein